MAELLGFSGFERRARISALREDARTKQLRCDRLALQMHRCTFTYSPPEPNFDPNRVMGTIFSLIEWYDTRYCTALELVAGEQLFSVVVDTEETSLLLMKKGKLARTTSFVMLDIVNGDVIDRDTLALAQQLGGGPDNVKLALDLISFDSKYEPVMKWAFGNALVVPDWDTAEKLAFHPDVEAYCVTVGGEVVEPNGAMSGGPMDEEPSVFHALQERKEIIEDLKKIHRELARLTAEEQL